MKTQDGELNGNEKHCDAGKRRNRSALLPWILSPVMDSVPRVVLQRASAAADDEICICNVSHLPYFSLEDATAKVSEVTGSVMATNEKSSDSIDKDTDALRSDADDIKNASVELDFHKMNTGIDAMDKDSGSDENLS